MLSLLPLAPERGARLLVLASRAVAMRHAGDVAGHEFHGNQWTDGAVGFDEDPAARYPIADEMRAYDERDAKRVRGQLKERGRLNADGTTSLYHVTLSDPESILKHGLIPAFESAPGQDWQAEHSSYATYFFLDKEHALDQVVQAGGGAVIEARIPVTGKTLSRFVPDEDSSSDRYAGVDVLVKGGAVAFIGGVPSSAVRVVPAHRSLGDVYGHEFHGNQWTGNGGERWRKGDRTDEGRVLNGVPLSVVERPDFTQSIKHDLVEPPLVVPKGKHVSAGIVVTEPDGSMWVVEPHNRYGGYRSTFPKGTVDKGENLQQTAAREVWEESGLVAKVTGHLADVERTTSVARFYTGVRVGGAPWAAGKETHAVKLIPSKGAEHTLKNVFGKFTSDHKVLDALRMKHLALGKTLRDLAFNENQSRDDRGRWTGGGDSSVKKESHDIRRADALKKLQKDPEFTFNAVSDRNFFKMDKNAPSYDELHAYTENHKIVLQDPLAANLYATQHGTSSFQVKQLIENWPKWRSTNPPFVVRYGGKDYITDGHTRLTAAKLLGVKIPVRLLKVDKAALRHAGDVAGHEFHGNQWTEGGQGEFFHGTSAERVDSILKNGITLDQKPGFAETKSGHTYVANTEHEATFWAREATLGSKDKGTVALLKIQIPRSVLKKLTGDENVDPSQGSFKFKGSIKPEWIVAAKIGEMSRGKSFGDVKWKHLKTAEGDFVEMWVAVLLDVAIRHAGDVAGHEFHGNQYTGGWPGGLQKIGEAAGSNPGGLYKDEHGQKWYVKNYPDAKQAAGEHVANAVYRAVGVRAPQSALGEGGKYASKWEADAGKTLAHTGLTKENADAVLDGFAADVFLSNWDAVGTGFDNVLVKGGQVTRIDQGGTLLHRAQGAPKPEAVLHQIGEWKTLSDPGMNSYYARIFKTAGLKGGDDLGARAVKQIDKIVAARPKDGWKGFVAHVAPSMGKDYAAKVGGILEERQVLLEKKRDELTHKLKAAGEWNEEAHPRVPAGSGDASGEFAGGPGSTGKAKKAPKAPPVPIEIKKLAYEDVKAGGTFKAVAAKHGMTQGQLAGHVWKVDQAKKKIEEALEEKQSIANVVKAKDVLPQNVLATPTPAASSQIWSKMTADEKLTAVTNEGYVWKEKANSKSGNHAWFDKNGAQVSGYAQKDQYKEQLNTIHNGEGPAQYKAPEVTAESTGHWPIANTVERKMSDAYETKVTTAFKPWAGKLSVNEKDAVGSYTGSGYSNLNEQLRGGGTLSPHVRMMEKNISSALDKAPTPPPPDLVWRGLSSPAAAKLFADLSPGDQFDMKGFQSTSIRPAMAHSWSGGNLVFEIKPAKGAYVKPLSSHKTEYEYLLPHGAKYTVRGVTYVKLEHVSAKVKVLQIEMHP